MHLQRIINIFLAFTLLISVAGVSSAKNQACCSADAEKQICCAVGQTMQNNCCGSEIQFLNLDADLIYTKSKVNIQDTGLPASLFSGLTVTPAVKLIKHNGSSYTSPLLYKDISVLYRVFRI